ncbi:MAG: hypothetical protein U0992_16060 [Planctomycetaceae bacterium]
MTRGAERYFPHLQFQWAASDLFHNPLYFENPALERYGHAHVHDCVEPFYSMARFSAAFVTLPYQIALDSPCRRQYALGWYRPGDFAPKLIYQPPLNARAAVGAAAAYTGLIFSCPDAAARVQRSEVVCGSPSQSSWPTRRRLSRSIA